LIDMEVEHTGKSYDQVVESFINDRKNYLMKIIELEKLKNSYINKINSVVNMADCDIISQDLTILYSKPWITTIHN
jgi:hypothetical protein